ncbi:MAG TPA: hypothetical protein VG755_09420 [Nannocystaceae bacterium]|nr:hypothetical protein [Nannocystaceae bacterium]
MSTQFLTTLVLGSVGLAALMPTPALAAPTTLDVQPTNIVEQLVPTKVYEGDREFDGHGPDITTTVNVRISDDGRKLLARVYFKARETQADWSTTKAEWERTVYTAPAGKTITRVIGAVEDGQLVDSPTCIGARAGRCIASSTSFKSEPAKFQFLMPGEDWSVVIDAIAELVQQIIRAEQQQNDRDQPTAEERQAMDVVTDIQTFTAGIRWEQNKLYTVPSETGGPVRLMAIVGDTGGPDISTDSNGRDDTRVEAIMFKKVRIELQ